MPRTFQSPSLRGSGRFRKQAEARAEAEARVSIPFIAGQWSLRGGSAGAAGSAGACFNLFQSPSLRGSGRFRSARGGTTSTDLSFNPLHCGAVVASKIDRPPPHGGGAGFQSPSLRGSGRFWKSSLSRLRRSSRFNPLHCGAVVASPCGVPRFRRADRVSIPFIAGQWSLHGGATMNRETERMFQSPSLRGSGRFTETFIPLPDRPSCFNPLHCGAVVASAGQATRAPA